MKHCACPFCDPADAAPAALTPGFVDTDYGVWVSPAAGTLHVARRGRGIVWYGHVRFCPVCGRSLRRR